MEFTPFPKIPRLFRKVIVTEKLDGTNASILIKRSDASPNEAAIAPYRTALAALDCILYDIFVGSRTRWITPGKTTDNYGFAAWVLENANELVKLGEGHHFGEWWGKGIQRGYGLAERRFSLFNTERWWDDNVRPACCHVVPIIKYSHDDIWAATTQALDVLRCSGSKAAPGYMNPEGVVVFHTALNGCFKATLDNDGVPKSLAA